VCSSLPLRSPTFSVQVVYGGSTLFCSYPSSDRLLLSLMPSWVATWLLEPWPLAELSSISDRLRVAFFNDCRFGFLRSSGLLL
jgi:hypothetical protein